MSRRGRALGFAALALLCAVGSASLASGYRESVDAQLGELRSVAVTTRALPRGDSLERRVLRKAVELREVPVRFLPPDALSEPAQLVGRKPAVAVPSGSYLLASMLRTPGTGQARAPSLAGGRQPVEITVTGAGALATGGAGAAAKVDVIVAAEPVTGGRARVRIAASAVRLIALEQAPPEQVSETGGDGWNATLALSRSEALELIEAENFAREIRLIPAG